MASCNYAIDLDRAESANLTIPTSGPSVAQFIVDSGCTRHMIGTTVPRSWLSRLTSSTTSVISFGGHVLRALGIARFAYLRNALYMPTSSNLLSISQLCKEGYTAVFTGDKFTMYPCNSVKCNGTPILSGCESGGLYTVQIAPTDRLPSLDALNTIPSHASNSAMLSSVVCDNMFTLWHNRLGHFSKSILDKLRNRSLYS